MNWTGGDLIRAASKKNNTTQQKQKAYFAKARAKASAPQQTPPDLRRSFLGPQPAPLTRSSIAIHNSQCPPLTTAPPASKGIDRAELKLLQKRQELLRRPDWLQLQVTKPLNIAFESRSDRALIGRRRRPVREQPVPLTYGDRPVRINKHRHDPTHDRIRLHNDQSLTPSSFQIKIGTGAFDSETAVGRMSQVEKRLSVELDLLSEEPMLLDSDDDLFESHQMPISNTTPNTHLIYGQRPGNIVPSFLQDRSPSPQISQRVQQSSFSHQHNISSGSTVPWSTSLIDAQSDTERLATEHFANSPAKNNQVTVPIASPHVQNIHLQMKREWRDFMGIHSLNAHTSLMPQKSDMTFTSAPQPRPQFEDHLRQPVLSSVVPETQAAVIVPRTQPVARTQQPVKVDTRPAVNQDQELWRSFVIGEGRSESEESYPRHDSHAVLQRDILESDYPMPAHHVSDIRSNMATQGIRDDENALASHIPLLSSVASVDKTTRAIASSDLDF